MDKQTIMNTIRFMERVDLKWNEVPAFNECLSWLAGIYEKEEPQDLEPTEE